MLLKNNRKTRITLPENARCSKCRKRVKNTEKYEVIAGKLYCHKCAQKKRDWQFIEFMALIDD